MLCLTPFAFSIAKRAGRADSPPAWFIAHVVAATVGVALLVVHFRPSMSVGPPALLLAGGLFLVVQGVWARVWLAHRVAGVFGGRYAAIIGPGDVDKERLRTLIDAKTALLTRLDRKARRSAVLAGAVPLVPPSAAEPSIRAAGEGGVGPSSDGTGPSRRSSHIGVRCILRSRFMFLAGLLVHVVTVTFFAGYVADGGPIDWWHLTAWGAP